MIEQMAAEIVRLWAALAEAEERAALAEAMLAVWAEPAKRDIDRQWDEQRPRLPADWQLVYEGLTGDWYCVHDDHGETDMCASAADAVNQALVWGK